MPGDSGTIVLLASLCFLVVTCDVIVETTYGKVRGLTTQKSQAFLGIPFAAPPVGRLRWKPPQPPRSWSPDVFDATKIKPACPQVMSDFIPARFRPNKVGPSGSKLFDTLKTDESCLFLYLWAPLTATPSSKLPVMVYIHGGNFVIMSANSPIYDGDNFVAEGNVILVSVDYRLGALGFLYTGSEGDAARGNFGLQDQRYALQWVKENIEAFGGDTSKVTLFGQSAGAQSTLVHVMSGKATGLFRSAIIESDPVALQYKTPKQAAKLADKFAMSLNCIGREDMACLRSKTTDEIVAAQQLLLQVSVVDVLLGDIFSLFQALGPVVDGDEVPAQPMAAARLPNTPTVPVVIGTVTEEGRLFVYGVVKTRLPKLAYDAVVAIIFSPFWLDVLKLYPCVSHDCRDILSDLLTDLIFTCATRNASTNLVNGGQEQVWRYIFGHAFSSPGWNNGSACQGHVCHSEEVPFVFDTAEKWFTPDEKTLSRKMIGYWTNFAYKSSPDTGPSSVSAWPELTAGKQVDLFFKTPNNHIVVNSRKKYCDFWDSKGYTL